MAFIHDVILVLLRALFGALFEDELHRVSLVLVEHVVHAANRTWAEAADPSVPAPRFVQDEGDQERREPDDCLSDALHENGSRVF